MLRVAVVSFPGSNCETETVAAAAAVGAEAYTVWHAERDLGQADIVILPGGFAHGDALRAGAIARFSPIMGAVSDHARAGGPTLGICNGFQVLCEAGLLPGALMRNAGETFLSRPLSIRVEMCDTPFTGAYEAGDTVPMPVAHGEGRFVASDETLVALRAEQRIVFRYAEENPNGSIDAIAGVCNAERNVVGLMPHPERRARATQGGSEGARIFSSMIIRTSLT